MSWYLKVLKQFADFNGRARRMEYWMFTLVDFVVTMVLMIPPMIIMFTTMDEGGDPGALFMLSFAPMVLYALVVLIPKLAVTVRRLHDQNRSGWWFLISFVPYIGGLVIFVLMLLDGTPGANRFGPDPKARGGAEGSDEVWPDVA